MRSLILPILLLFCSQPAVASEPPKAACPAAQAPVVVFVPVRPLTIGERIIDRRQAQLADQQARLAERRSRSAWGFGVIVRVGVGGCR